MDIGGTFAIMVLLLEMIPHRDETSQLLEGPQALRLINFDSQTNKKSDSSQAGNRHRSLCQNHFHGFVQTGSCTEGSRSPAQVTSIGTEAKGNFTFINQF